MTGSKISKHTTPSISDYALRKRNENKDNITTDGILTKNILLNSPSAVAKFVYGYSISGNIAWKTEERLNLKELESQQIP